MRDLPSKSHSNRQAPKKSLETPLLQCLKITKHFFFFYFIHWILEYVCFHSMKLTSNITTKAATKPFVVIANPKC